MEAEHVQAAPTRPRRNEFGRRIQLPLVLGMIGIVLILVALLGLLGSYSLTRTEPPYGDLTVHCGTVVNATGTVPTLGFSSESRVKLRTTGSASEAVVAIKKLSNSCRTVGQLRLDGSVILGALGLAAVVAGFVIFGRNKAGAPVSSTESRSSG